MDKLKFLPFVFTAYVLVSCNLGYVFSKPLVDDCQDHDMVDCARIRGTPVCREVWVYEYCPVSCGVCGMQIPGSNGQQTCRDEDSECDTIQGDQHESCKDVVVRENCPKTCGLCGHHHPKLTHPPHLLKTTQNLNINITTTSPPRISSVVSVQLSSQKTSSQVLTPSSSGRFEATLSLSSTTTSTPLPPQLSSLVSVQPSSQQALSLIPLSSSYDIVKATSIVSLPSNSPSSSSQVSSAVSVQPSGQQASTSITSLSSRISSRIHNQITDMVSSSIPTIYETAKVTPSSESVQPSSYQQVGQQGSSSMIVTSPSSPEVGLVSDYLKIKTKSSYIQASSSFQYAVSSLVQKNQETSSQLQHSNQVSSPIPRDRFSNHMNSHQASVHSIQQTSSAVGYMQSQLNTLQSSKEIASSSDFESSSLFLTKMTNKPSKTSTVSSIYRQSQMIYPTVAITDAQSSSYAIDGFNSVDQLPTSSVFAQHMASRLANSIAPTLTSSVAVNPSLSQSTESTVEVDVVTAKGSPDMTSSRMASGASVYLTDESTSTTTTLPNTTPTAPIEVANGVSCRACEDPFCKLGFESIVKCPDASPYCMNTVRFDSQGKKTLEKGCARIQDCNQNLIEQSSQSTKCLHYNDNNFYTDLKCNFCCVSDGCNIYTVPKENTRYGVH